MTISDNTAANLLVRRLGGGSSFNSWLRELGDPMTRLDRAEPQLNSNHPGDLRDTSTPKAMAQSAAKLLFGSALEPAERQMLRDWLIASQTGLKRIRAALPDGYVAGDKTGTCGAKGRESYNDVAFIVPDSANGAAGYILAVYLDRPAADAAEADRSIAELAAVAADLIGN